MGKGLDTTLAILNGLIGDYLTRTENGLATEMSFYHRDRPLAAERAALEAAFPTASPRFAVFVHGLMNTEHIWRWPDGNDYGSLLERDLGWTAAYLRYNTGVAIPDNGARLSALLEQLLAAYPTEIEELALIGFSMGGLVIRSACHAAVTAQHTWPARVRRIVYIGTPHLGAPAERVGKFTSDVLRAIPNAYTRLVSDIANLRSVGIQDLAHATLRHEDRVPAQSVWDLRDARHPAPLHAQIEHHVIAGSLFGDDKLGFAFGDSLVPISSATYSGIADQLLPRERVHVLPGLNHIALAHDPAVYEILKASLKDPP